MAYLDAKITPKVQALIRKIGRDGVLRTYPGAIHDAVQGSNTQGTPTDHNVIITPLLNFDKALINGDSVRDGDCYIFISESPVVPDTTMEMIVDSKPWKIVSVKTHSPGTTVAAYELQLRSGGQ